MTEKEQKTAAKNFADYWKDKGYEKGESQPFWLSLLREVLGVEKPETIIRFEDKVMLDHTSFIDGIISSTHVLIEQKSADKNLRKAIKQSDGSYLTPFQQAKRYSAELPYSERPRWIVACNFREFLIYDMEKPTGEPDSILLSDLPKECYRLKFLIDTGSESVRREMEISIKAGELVGVLYDEILKQYKDPAAESTLKSLNMLCVRLVFCLYAEDSGLFGEHMKFHNYIKGFAVKDVRRAIIDMFKALDTKLEERDPYMDETLASFPYVNGGLFADEDIEIPQFNEKIVQLLLRNASENFDWSEISPTIFGAVFESTLNPETRRSGGMHYTSIENIHKVIDPLFLDNLRDELTQIKTIQVEKTRTRKLEEYRKKLSSLIFLDPACGSGNFLTETYLSLRRLENEALKLIHNGQMVLGLDDLIKVSIGQFYGIEINDFAVTVAKTALWIAESQMMKETEEIVNMTLDFLPLKSYASIIEANALRLDWESVVSKDKLNYIMGNPPFHGFTFMTANQKEDMQMLFSDVKNLDFVCAWYKKASDYICGTRIEVAFVSTNSIVQGETVSRFWQFMNSDIINFAYRTFIWDSEAAAKAHVHCVIIGFAKFNRNEKYIYDGDYKKKAKNINYYLVDGANIIVESRNKPLCNVPQMIYGNKPADGGALIIEDYDYKKFVESAPAAKKFIKPLLGATEYINGKKRWCLWLVGASPEEIRKIPVIMERVQQCKIAREKSIAAGIRKFAATPTLFAQRTQPTDKDFIIVPRVSSQNRKYIPIGFIKAGTIVTDRVQIIPDATLYDFGVVISNIHMAWMRATCMRLKSDYSYSKDIVYNNFPWPKPTKEQKAKIEQTAQAILDARALYPDSSLADLYDELTMPVELRRAHQQNDKAVMQAYGFDYRSMTESECVAELMKMYQELTEEI